MIIFFLATFFMILHLVVVYKKVILGNRQRGRNRLKESNLRERKLSIIIPCYNEEVVIENSIKSFLDNKYKNIELIFVIDGSKDRTLKILKDILHLEIHKGHFLKKFLKHNRVKGIYRSRKRKNFYVIDKENGGKADSLNAGINFATSDYVVTLDADSILREDALFQINKYLKKDVIAVGGSIVVAQGVKGYNKRKINCNRFFKILEGMQFIEYLRSFFVLKHSYAKLNALFVISGAFGVFNKEVMFEVGGFRKTIGEDIDVTIKFNKYAKEHNKKIEYNDKAICFTEAPDNLRDLVKQRVRWQKGLLDTVKYNLKYLRKNIFKSRLAFFILIEACVVMYLSTIVTLVGILVIANDIIRGIPIGIRLYVVLIISGLIFIIYNVMTIILAIKADIKINELGILTIIGLSVYEIFFYRPMVLFINLYGSLEYIFKPTGWNKVKRIGICNK